MISWSVNWRKHMCLLANPNLLMLPIFRNELEKEKKKTQKDKDTSRWNTVNEKMAWKTHNCRMGKAWRCVTLEKASSLLLPWQWSLLGNYVAMARVSSVMQTWPHPPTSSPAVKSREASLLAKCQRVTVHVFVCMCVWEIAFSFLFLACSHFFFLQAANFSLHW